MTVEEKKAIMHSIVVEELGKKLERRVEKLNKKYLDDTVKDKELLEEEKYIKKLQRELEEVRVGRRDLRNYYDIASVAQQFENDEDYILGKIK